ncbi:hypothetical protein L593_02790 [Salinarchaeum sp. Harcht-Bsk1]|uniref:hypothetical protein n=1 Tax=Salinarchaeum sp. Harcht-Bsk1 TaxID=1333523 RepID=UPI0003423BF9|nr:hypothetical protein [Salinarchaeum sp. Harcht-Bsk1]AGN00509.1 hypothetical protein L593_02790 [Salinarchaeum sp. Harcht-Bsk1]
MDADLAGDLDAEQYDDLVADLAAQATTELPDRSRADAVWDTVGTVVPQLTDPVCNRVLDLADSEPRDALVEQVTSERGSDDAERLRAEALTALVGDVEARVVADTGDDTE